MATPGEMAEQIGSLFKNLSLVQKIAGGLVVALFLGFLLSLVFGKAGTEYRVLFSGLSQEDAAEVVNSLQERRIPYELAAGGNAIRVPAEQVYEMRLALAGEGLPRGGGVGFEIFDQSSFGTTDFVQRLNYQRALQGELARTIRQFEQVLEARVHIATPKESVFIEDEKPPTASVSVKLRDRQKLTKVQIQSIVNLVASAVPGLSPDQITVVDTSGRLLFHQKGDENAILSATQLEYQQEVEEALRRKVQSLLAGVVGGGRVQAQVTAEIDFNRVDLTEETFDPDGQVVRSEQTLTEEEQRNGGEAQGIPGVKGELATFAEAGEAGTGEGFRRNNLTRNYEISRVTRRVREMVGAVNRLSVAVMVDGSYEKVVDKDGNASLKYQPRPPEEMQRLERIVKNAIGYSEERGDQVEVVNLSFDTPTALVPEIDPMERWRELIERLAMPLIYLLLGISFLLFVVRPFFRLMSAKQSEAQRLAEQTVSAPGPEREEDFSFSSKGLTDQERIYKLAQTDPARAADLVRRWLREG